MTEVQIFADGACRGNPGPGGWGTIVYMNGREVYQLKGSAENTTNNQMELAAVICGLHQVVAGSKVEVVSDSKYVVDGINSWLRGWKAKGWRGSAGPIKNLEQWQEIDQLIQMCQVSATWVKGHAGHPQNEACDLLANEAIDDLLAGKPSVAPAQKAVTASIERASVPIQSIDMDDVLEKSAVALGYKPLALKKDGYQLVERSDATPFWWNPMLAREQFLDLLTGLRINISFETGNQGDLVTASKDGATLTLPMDDTAMAKVVMVVAAVNYSGLQAVACES